MKIFAFITDGMVSYCLLNVKIRHVLFPRLTNPLKFANI